MLKPETKALLSVAKANKEFSRATRLYMCETIREFRHRGIKIAACNAAVPSYYVIRGE